MSRARGTSGVALAALLLLAAVPLGADEVPPLVARGAAHVGSARPFARGLAVRTRADVRFAAGRHLTTVVSARDGRMRFAQSSSFCAGVDVGGAWAWDAQRGARAPIDSATESVLRGHELHALVQDPGSRWRWAGVVRDTVFRTHRALAAHYHDALGAPAVAFYARRDSLPLGFAMRNHSGRGPVAIDVVLSRWRVFAGARWFTRAVFHQGADRFEHRYLSVESTAPADSLFAPGPS